MAKIAKNAASIQPFHVMRLLEQARLQEKQGISLVHMEIGEPDFPLARPVANALRDAIQTGDLGYTPACGLPELRRAIADSYSGRVDWRNIIVTPGSSGAIQLALACLLDPGDEVLLPDPGYPCNRNIVNILGGKPVAINVDAATGYQPTADHIRQAWSENTVAVMLASPANPTGAVMGEQALSDIIAVTEELGGALIMDEIYSGLVYGVDAPSAAGRGDHVFVVSSFSKYHGLTGLRTGWLVAPERYAGIAEKLAQNLFLSASTLGQYGALAALSEPALALFEKRRKIMEERLSYLVEALPELGFTLPTKPQGAFYVYADCSALTDNSFGFCDDLLTRAGVVVTPGKDFGDNQPQRHVRFSCTADMEQLREGMRRLEQFLNQSA